MELGEPHPFGRVKETKKIPAFFSISESSVDFSSALFSLLGSSPRSLPWSESLLDRSLCPEEENPRVRSK